MTSGGGATVGEPVPTHEALANWFWEHEHAHVASNNPGGHLCSRRCVSEALMRSRWLAAHVDGRATQALAPIEALADAIRGLPSWGSVSADLDAVLGVISDAE